MENRFIHMDLDLSRHHGARRSSGMTATLPRTTLAMPLSAADRVLVVLIENGGVDLGIPELVDQMLRALPGTSVLPDSMRSQLVKLVRDKVREVTDALLEGMELSLNRYESASPDLFGAVVVLRNGTATAGELQRTLQQATEQGKVVDLLVLTHGGPDSIAITGGMDGAQIRRMRQDASRPLALRSVYMMNCNGSTLNQAWLDAGARVACGSIRTNYLPEPTMFFFWQRWKRGDTFQDAATGAYQQTIRTINDLLRNVLPSPLSQLVGATVDASTWGFVRDSAPVVSGQGKLTITSDDLSTTQSVVRGMAITVVPLSAGAGTTTAPATTSAPRRSVSPHGMEMIRRQEGNRPDVADRIAEAQEAIGRLLTTPLGQDQHDALVSLVTDIGVPAFERSTLLRLVTAGSHDAVPAEIRRWVKVRRDGAVVVDPALVSRRATEADLYDREVVATARSLMAGHDATSRAKSARDRLAEGEHATCGVPAVAVLGQAAVSRSMFDTGEHVRAGEGALTATLRIGGGAGVAASYGEIIALADLYATVDQLMTSPTSEVSRVLDLVRRSHAHHSATGARPANPSNTEWSAATGGRYLQLAEDNHSHFAPDTLLTGDPQRGTLSKPDNRSTWEAHHRRALTEAASLHADPANANRSVLPEGPLVTNAFGDHFLTDAFAAGHLINKEAMINLFRARFFSGTALTSAAEAFFGRVADKAFVGKVSQRFSSLETTDYPVCAWGWCLRWHPNINSASRFATLLREAARQQPDRIANFAVKALHDKLNRDGADVTNQAGDSWHLTGDDHLNAQTLTIMQRAVAQSVANVTDPELQTTSVDPAPYVQRVWRHVPELTPSEQTRVRGLLREYTDPSSTVLSDAAASIVTSQLDQLIQVLLDEGKLKRA